MKDKSRHPLENQTLKIKCCYPMDGMDGLYNPIMEGLKSLTPYLKGEGEIKHWEASQVRLEIPPIAQGYADSQLDDTQNTPRSQFRWTAPLRLSLRMRCQPAVPIGTLGFGFWNDPFAFSLGAGGAQRRLPATPQAIWFFYGSKPNQLEFVPNSLGEGWKAMCIRSPQLPSLLLLPGAAFGLLLNLIPLFRRPLMKFALAQITAVETRLSTALDEWHTYDIHWEVEQVSFHVDGQLVLRAHSPPRVPLGFVAWIDNQYGIVSPVGGVRFGTIPTSRTQWIEIQDFSLK
jgi:hypothetical protein